MAVTTAITSPLDSFTPNIVIMTLKTSSPYPVSACAGLIEITTTTINASITPISDNDKTIIPF
ncbi:MAG TPA: hypothetical protein VFR94_13285 [Nitrososphaeraceae archaeon]|nr:hypothetical protein [Nitrososphaeraceae archaeon]